MKRTLICGLFLALGLGVRAQVLTVKDKIDNHPLELVSISSVRPQVSAMTDPEGKVDLAAFNGADSLFFNLLGFRPAAYSLQDLRTMSFVVLMQPDELTFDEIVVSASRWEQDKREIPVRIASIKPEEVVFQNPQTAADLLGASGEVFIQKSQLGGGSPMIRGFATNRVLIAVDGVRMNTAIFRSGNLQNVISLDPLSLDRTEVIFGPGSVIYGSDAIGGVMSFYTLKPHLSSGDKAMVNGSALARWSSAGSEKTGHFDVNIGLPKWGFTTSVTYSDFGDLKMGKHGPEEYLRNTYGATVNGRDTMLTNPDPLVQRPTGYNQLNVMQKIRFKPGKDLEFNYGFHYSNTSDYSRYDRLIRYRGNGNQRSGEWYYGPQKWMMNALNIAHAGSGGLYDNLSATIALQNFEESRHDRDFGDSELRSRVEQVDVFSVNLDLERGLSGKSTVFYGLEALFNNVNSTGTDKNIETGAVVEGPARYPNPATWNSYAAYATYRYKPSRSITWQAGLRYNQVALDAEFNQDFYDFPFKKAEINSGALTGSIGAAWLPAESWQLNLNLSTGFRVPNVDDVGKVFDSEPGSVVIPNPDLEAEYAWNAEAGISKIIGGVAKVDFTAYYTILDHALVRRDFTLNGQDSILYDSELSQVQAIQNAAQAHVFGIQAGFELKLPAGFGLTTRFNYQNGEEELDDGSTAPLRHAAPWFGATHFTWKRERAKLDLYAVYNGEVSYENLAPEEQGKGYIYAMDADGNPYSPAWYTLNFKAMYQLTDNLSITAGMENITDQRYRPYSSGIVAAGRNVMVSGRLRF